MTLYNTTRKIFGIGAVDLLPGEEKTVPANFESNPILLAMIEEGKLTQVSEAEKKPEKEPGKEPEKEPEKKPEKPPLKPANEKNPPPAQE